jgi:broad specificity phosphatase PhoE
VRRRRDRWPASLTLVRHGESAGNVARDLAEAAGLPVIDIALRDADVPLSDRGCDQARAVGRWLAGLGRRAPTVVWASPYVRARQTAELAVAEGGLRTAVVLDERLREREFGVLDRLTKVGITERHPEQAEARARVGKFYHRPPGGESWCDVVLRVRSALDTVGREHAGERVLIVAHQVVILAFRYVLEHLDEATILAISREHELANCSITSYVLGRGGADGTEMRLERFNEPVALEETGAPVTAEPDVPLAPR